MTPVRFSVPVRTVSEANEREHYHAKADRAREQRAWIRIKWRELSSNALSGSLTVTMTRVAPRVLDDDNLSRSCKAIRDELAACLGLKDDRDERVTWRYTQRKGAAREYAIEIEIARRVLCSECGQAK